MTQDQPGKRYQHKDIRNTPQLHTGPQCLRSSLRTVNASSVEKVSRSVAKYHHWTALVPGGSHTRCRRVRPAEYLREYRAPPAGDRTPGSRYSRRGPHGAACEIPPGTPAENLKALCQPVPYRKVTRPSDFTLPFCRCHAIFFHHEYIQKAELDIFL